MLRRIPLLAAVLGVLLAYYAAAAGTTPTGGRLPWQRGGRRGDTALLRILPPNGYQYTEGSGAALTASKPSGQAITVTRTGNRTCTLSTGLMTNLSSNQPCVAGSPLGLYAGMQVQNRALRSEEFENASWTNVNVTVTANQAVSPLGTTTMDSLQSTIAGGYLESTGSTQTGTVAHVSVYVATAAGTQAGTLILRDTTAGTDVCTLNFTATTTTTRIYCRATGLTAARVYTLRLYPGGTGGTGTLLAWGAQNTLPANGASSAITRYVPTTSATVTSNVELIQTSNPTPADGYCIAATVTHLEIAGLIYVMALGSTAPALTNGASLSMLNSGISSTFIVNDHTPTQKSAGNTITPTGEHRYCGCASGGTLTQYVDGVLVSSTILGAGTGIITVAPALVRLGSTENNALTDNKIRNYATGPSMAVCR